jgi:hypothetical protein
MTDRIDMVGFEVLTAVSMKMTVFWVVAPCSLVEVYQRFRGPCCLHHPDDLLDYMVLQPRRQPSSELIWTSCSGYTGSDGRPRGGLMCLITEHLLKEDNLLTIKMKRETLKCNYFQLRCNEYTIDRICMLLDVNL